MRQKIVYIIIAAALFCASCTSSRFNTSERWEGIWFNKLRVHVVIDLQGSDMNTEKTGQKVRALCRDRALFLLRSYIYHTGTDKTDITAVEKSINSALKTGKIIHMDCSNDRCEAFAEYSVKQVLVLLKKDEKDESGRARQ